MEHETRRAEAILSRRTALLAARGRGAGEAVAEHRSVILWQLGEERAAIEVGHVAAVLPYAGCAPVPTRQPACLGVISRAGRFYSVIDMRQLAGSAAPWPGEAGQGAEGPGHLVLLRGGTPHLALAVDQVLGRFELSLNQGALEMEGRFVSLLEPAALRAQLSG